jgi:hypothetical protein
VLRQSSSSLRGLSVYHEHIVGEASRRPVTAADRPAELQRRLGAAQVAHRSPSCGTAAASSISPRATARSIAALRLVTPNLR